MANEQLKKLIVIRKESLEQEPVVSAQPDVTNPGCSGQSIGSMSTCVRWWSHVCLLVRNTYFYVYMMRVKCGGHVGGSVWQVYSLWARCLQLSNSVVSQQWALLGPTLIKHLLLPTPSHHSPVGACYSIVSISFHDLYPNYSQGWCCNLLIWRCVPFCRHLCRRRPSTLYMPVLSKLAEITQWEFVDITEFI